MEPRLATGAPSFARAVVMAAIGYLAPMGILVALCSIRWGWTVVIENLGRIWNAHLSLSLNSLVLLLPNFACMVFFAVSGYRRPLAVRPLSLGAATLIGYFVMALTTMYWFQLPWTWSAIAANGFRSSIVMAFPCLLFALQNLMWKEAPTPY